MKKRGNSSGNLLNFALLQEEEDSQLLGEPEVELKNSRKTGSLFGTLRASFDKFLQRGDENSSNSSEKTKESAKETYSEAEIQEQQNYIVSNSKKLKQAEELVSKSLQELKDERESNSFFSNLYEENALLEIQNLKLALQTKEEEIRNQFKLKKEDVSKKFETQIQTLVEVQQQIKDLVKEVEDSNLAKEKDMKVLQQRNKEMEQKIKALSGIKLGHIVVSDFSPCIKMDPSLLKGISGIQIANAREMNVARWKIKEFSTLSSQPRVWSPEFRIFGFKWKLLYLPIGRKEDPGTCGLFLECLDIANSTGWHIQTNFVLRIRSPNNPSLSYQKDLEKFVFTSEERRRGYYDFIETSKLNDPNNSFVINDTILFEVEIRQFEVEEEIIDY